MPRSGAAAVIRFSILLNECNSKSFYTTWDLPIRYQVAFYSCFIDTSRLLVIYNGIFVTLYKCICNGSDEILLVRIESVQLFPIGGVVKVEILLNATGRKEHISTFFHFKI